ncbi:radical SAM protein [Helicobacter sp. 11S02596-1]|uniref:radical SAM protein n=1 Tax=Helicobacter sp. 11S02596-1 TaxID=1476194 RepID=UPI000BA68337|nr:radical SAM protein [Helicobacter sp. 11S02596-1]PAF45153.1 molybdenum cofactor biosynthesis protein MoaA [Helicobacter sp. 11S02596-1]
MKINNFNSDEKILRYPEKIDHFLNFHKTLVVAELDLTNKCNHRCPGCCGHNENNAELSKEQVEAVVAGLKSLDCKGVILSGGGEPTISPHFQYAISLLKKAGINIGLNSHGMSLDESKAITIANNLEYFRISLDAGSPEMYQKIHGMKPHHFEKTLENIALFARIKKELNSKTSFGVGFLTSELTQCDMEPFVQLVKGGGADFAQFRPFTGNTLDILPILKDLREKYEDEHFKIVASYQKYKEMSDVSDRGYSKCHGMFFSTVVSADFKVWACLHFRQSEKHFLGDLREQTMEEIWRGSRIREVYESINCAECPILCRNDSFNRTLDRLSLDITNSEFL